MGDEHEPSPSHRCSSCRGFRPIDVPRQLLSLQGGEDAAVDAAGDRRSRSYHPSVGAAAVVVSVTSTPRQLLSPRGGRDDAPWNRGHPSSSSAVTAAVASIQWAPRQLSPLRVTRRVPITPPSGPSSRRGLSPRPHDRRWRLGVIQKNSSHRGRRPNDTPRQLLPLRVTRRGPITPPSGPSSRRGLSPRPHDRWWRLGVMRQNSVAGSSSPPKLPPRRRASAAAAVSVVATPQQLLPPREAAVESRRRSHPSPSLAVTAAVASTFWAPLQLPPLGEGVAARAASRRRASAAAAISVVATPQQLLPPREAAVEEPPP